MTTCCTMPTEWPREALDFLAGTVTANIVLDAQPVAISFDGDTWITAEWQGAAGLTRDWLAYVTPADLPDAMTVEVLVRILDTSDPGHPITAIIPAGTITFT